MPVPTLRRSLSSMSISSLFEELNNLEESRDTSCHGDECGCGCSYIGSDSDSDSDDSSDTGYYDDECNCSCCRSGSDDDNQVDEFDLEKLAFDIKFAAAKMAYQTTEDAFTNYFCPIKTLFIAMHRVGQPQPHAPRLLLLVRSAIQLSESAERAYFVVDEFTQAAINYWLEVGDTLRNAAISEDIETALIFDGLAERADDIVVCLGELGENAEEPPSPRSAKEM